MSAVPPPPPPPRRKRSRLSVWSLLAPLALITVVGSLLYVLGQQGVIGGDDGGTQAAQTTTEATDTPAAADAGPCGEDGVLRGYRVQPGDTVQSILETWDMDAELFQESNPKITDSYTIQAGEIVRVCKPRGDAPAG